MPQTMHLMQMFIHSASTHTSKAWADPKDGQAAGLGSFAFWQDIARTLERGRFDGIFFADVAAVHDEYPDGTSTLIQHGVSWPNHDPMPLVAAMAAATERLGIGVTLSTNGTPPYLAVRRISTLDCLSQGRVGWNIVTGINRAEHRANGIDPMEHDERYDYADEYMAICYALWDGIEPGAIVMDRNEGIFADPKKVHAVDFKGKYLKAQAVPPVIPSPQRRPVLFQAGSSGRGLRFAIEHAEVVFTIQPHGEGMGRFIGQAEAVAREIGKPKPRVLVGIQPTLASTEAEAKRRAQELKDRAPVEAVLARLSGNLGVDFSKIDPDRPLAEMNSQASRGLLAAVSARPDGRPTTLRDVADNAKLAVGIPALIGTPEQVADRMEALFRETGCYGFNISPTTSPGSIDEFVDEVVPILQKRGLFRTEYPGRTFRDSLNG